MQGKTVLTCTRVDNGELEKVTNSMGTVCLELPEGLACNKEPSPIACD
ncbi:MAG: hypothetical protein P4L69_01035 [Desulfosporosinus sp.]|nr:hypothetical protein [Desulfosporosinus sp.]